MPLHSPLLAASVWPSCGSPETTGGAVFDGGSAVTAAVGVELASAEPAEFVAVTSTRSLAPTSSWTAV